MKKRKMNSKFNLNLHKEKKYLIKSMRSADTGGKALKNIEVIQKYLIKTEKSKNKFEKKFNKTFHYQLTQLNKKTLLIKNDKYQSIVKELFRNSIRKYIFKSPLCKYGYIKPKGYPGDYKIIEAIYNTKPLASKNTIGYLFDQFLLQDEYVQSIRDRKDKMKILLKNYISKNKSDKVKILNIACGSCREIRELLNEGFYTNKIIEFVLIDQDKECLNYSKKFLKGFPSNYKFHFLQSNVYSFFRNDTFEKKFGKFDFIYSIGLADYLSDMVLGDMILKGFGRLTKDGRFIIAHKNLKEFESIPSDWVCDWIFIPRNRDDVNTLLKIYLSSYNYNANFENLKSKLIFFIMLEKRIKLC